MNFYDIKITGKDVKRFVHNLHKMHIELLNIEYLDKGVLIKVSKDDYQRIKEIKTIYQIEIIKLYGIIRVKAFFQKYYLFFIVLLLGFLLFLGLTNLIFEVDVIHSDKDIREIILNELEEEGISKYHFVVSFDKKEKIRNKILKKYQDKIEWLEIERQGTRYEIKVEERKKNNEIKDNVPKDIVARKNGLVKKIVSSSGEILVKKDQYVKEGDILISGTIHNKEEVVGKIRAEGNIYAETWYTVSVELPYHYHEEVKTNKYQKAVHINFLSNLFKWFRFHNYQNSNFKILYQVKSPILPISISLVEEEEIVIIDKVYSKDNAILEASEISKKRLKESLGDDIEILYEKNLKIIEEDSKIEVVMFYKVYEEISKLQDIKEEILPEEE